MREMFGDLWEIGQKADAIVITTNGTVKKNGQAVMGRGCALEAAKRYPGLPQVLGGQLISYGNSVWTFLMPQDGTRIVTLPVKHNWWEGADKTLIAAGLLELIEETDEKGWRALVMPRPGCGNGGLHWQFDGIRDMLAEVLDDRFIVVTHARA